MAVVQFSSHQIQPAPQNDVPCSHKEGCERRFIGGEGLFVPPESVLLARFKVVGFADLTPDQLRSVAVCSKHTLISKGVRATFSLPRALMVLAEDQERRLWPELRCSLCHTVQRVPVMEQLYDWKVHPLKHFQFLNEKMLRKEGSEVPTNRLFLLPTRAEVLAKVGCPSCVRKAQEQAQAGGYALSLRPLGKTLELLAKLEETREAQEKRAVERALRGSSANRTRVQRIENQGMIFGLAGFEDNRGQGKRKLSEEKAAKREADRAQSKKLGCGKKGR